MFRTLDVGRSALGRLRLRLAALVDNYAGWVATVGLAAREMWRYPVYGPGVTDHHHRPAMAPAASAVGKKRA
jgi:hypothetical protein